MDKVHVVMYAVPEVLDPEHASPENTICGVHLEIKTEDLKYLTPEHLSDLFERYGSPAFTVLLSAISESISKDQPCASGTETQVNVLAPLKPSQSR